MLFGDSITQGSFAVGGWGARIADKYSRHADVTVRGYSGYNSRWALHLLPMLFPQERVAPALVTIFFGANDAQRPGPLPGRDAGASRQHVPLDEYRENLKKMIAAVRACGDGSGRVLLIAPPPVDERAWGAAERQKCADRGAPWGDDGVCSRTNENTGRYADAVLAVGRETDTPVADLWRAFQSRDDWAALLSDGLHPGPEGAAVAYEELSRVLAEAYPELAPDWPQPPWHPSAGGGQMGSAGGLLIDAPEHTAFVDEPPGDRAQAAPVFAKFLQDRAAAAEQCEAGK